MNATEWDRYKLLGQVKDRLEELRKCCSGANVHDIAQIRTALLLSKGLLERENWREHFPNAQKIYREKEPEARAHYLFWLSIQIERQAGDE